jgi:thiamine transport system ATP-binding protein
MLEIAEISKRFAPDKLVLNQVSLTVPDGEIACLLGPSGCGKTTLLRIVAGLETANAGTVRFDDVDLAGVPVHQRHFGLMFQDYALFPHMTVARNVAFGLRMAGWSKAQIQGRVDAMLDLVNLRGYGSRTVDELSGGEQQRVALARTLAPAPRLVMLDEPLANLDRLLREELVDELRAILKQIGVTTLFVTHDQQEAFALSDRVVVLRAGHIEQDGTPQSVYRQPANAFVAGFLGFHNLLPATLSPGNLRQVTTPLGNWLLAGLPADGLPNRSFSLLIRPDAAQLPDAGTPPDAPRIAGRVNTAIFRGSIYRLTLTPAADPARLLSFDLPAGDQRPLPAPGDDISLVLDEMGMILVAGDDQ